MPAAIDAPKQRRSRSQRGQGDRLREEILAAAEALLIQTSDQSALSIRAIASAVGVTPPSIYLHFADRNELLFAVCERHALQLEAAMVAAADGLNDPLERLRSRGAAYLNYGLDHPEHYRILMMSRPDSTPDRFIDERLVDTAGLSPVIEDLQAAVDRGLIAPQDPMKAAQLLWMLIHGMVSLLISKPDFPFPPAAELYEKLFDVLRAGLAVEG
ncbi:MAG: TetR/AcrR family transcriptional regulator [Actinomycetota bacterium]|nr:TetR/AcrR family transcriptional regulator [Actinomycetota bacterium]